LYNINEISKLTNLTKRTLRHYHDIGLLVPQQKNGNNYRIYSDLDLLKLQDILLFKALDYSLVMIKEIVNAPNFDKIRSLENQSKEIDKKIEDLILIKSNIKNTIKTLNGGKNVKNEKLFENLKTKRINDNEKKYGKELRNNYGNIIIDQSNKKLENQTQKDFESAAELEELIKVQLKEATLLNDLNSDIAHELAKNHQKWIMSYWPNYSKESHIGLVDMYLSDERFKKYYDDIIAGGALFLNQAVKKYLK